MDKYWVTMTDANILGQKVTKRVFECEGIQEAKAVFEVSHIKPGMIRQSISRRKPYFHSDYYTAYYYTRNTTQSGWYPVKEDKPNEV